MPAWALLFLSISAFAQSSIRGFPPPLEAEHRQRELKARLIPEASRIRTYMQRMSAEPHHAGSPASRAVAEYALGLLREWGFDARIETFEALLPYPTSRVVELVEPVRYRARLQEPILEEDSDSGDLHQLPTYNAYSASGDVTAPLLYVNYGLPDDYEHLKRLGIDPKGKIVIARYGQSWRGTKAKVAHEHGVAGCIIYSDPRDDGYFRGDVYPAGAFRPPHGVQRGSVMDMPLYVGDPLSPGWASEPGSKRLKLEEAQSIMKIPVLPMSYEDASALMRHLGGPVAPEAWRGALGFTYHVGPGPAKVRLKLDFDWSTRPVHNVIARIPGTDWPDQWILYGNHHDAWVNGASDPLSGASSLLESARSLAEMRRTGWRPRRTLLFALWDAEEFGLVGSTEWVEKHQEELDQKLAVYINSDSTGKGGIGASGSHSLEQFVREVLRDIQDPASGKPLLEARRPPRNGSTATPEEFRLGSLGAGSDYVAFLDHAGVSSLNLGFGGEGGGGVYHSIYDSFAWYTRFSDGDFTYGRTLSAVTATMLMRLSGAAFLPFEFGSVARTIQRFSEEIVKVAGKDAGKLDLRDLNTELGKLAAAAKTLEADYQAAARRDSAPPDRLGPINEALYRTERAWTLASGLPGRPWYKHHLYAPGMYTGYGAKTLPGVREAVEAARWEEANQQATVASGAIRSLTAELGRISAMLRALP
ncbi:MAG: M28 family peptidase [Acidobacteria bacterium]|nr:M28 family peptidase [Acidobacteriota bacterium]